MLVVAGLTIISTLFVWRYHDVLSEVGLSALTNVDKVATETGIGCGYGYGTLFIFAVALLIPLMGNRKAVIPTGSVKFALLLTNGLGVFYHVIVISIFLIQSHYSPAYGVYVAFVLSLINLTIPYMFKKDGSLGMATPGEIADDIEDSAEDFEDTMEDFGDKVEDKVEDLGDKIEDKFDRDEDDDEKNESGKDDASKDESKQSS